MTAPVRTAAAPAPSPSQIERAAQVRELIHAQMYFVRIYAGVVEDLAGAGDDLGITYGLEKLALYTKIALALRVDLDAIGKKAT
jgi:hypothetical protein